MPSVAPLTSAFNSASAEFNDTDFWPRELANMTAPFSIWIAAEVDLRCPLAPDQSLSVNVSSNQPVVVLLVECPWPGSGYGNRLYYPIVSFK